MRGARRHQGGDLVRRLVGVAGAAVLEMSMDERRKTGAVRERRNERERETETEGARRETGEAATSINDRRV